MQYLLDNTDDVEMRKYLLNMHLEEFRTLQQLPLASRRCGMVERRTHEVHDGFQGSVGK